MTREEDNKQLFTQEQIELFLPNLEHPISRDEYLSTLVVNNDGFDFGDVLDYDSDEESMLLALAQSYCMWYYCKNANKNANRIYEAL